MTSETPSNKPSLVSRYSALVTALTADTDTQFVLSGKTYSKSAVLGVLSAYADAHQATAARRQAWMAAVGVEDTALANARTVRSELKTFLQGRLGKTSPDLARYGFEPAKVPTRTVAEKAAAVAKNKATRTARHTMGSTQKKSVKGTVPAPAAQPSAAATPVAPGNAASAPPAGSSGGTGPHVP
jgi:hypothetical protein